jgi:LmbE family N-acetylglucosaminyl deacetylase
MNVLVIAAHPDDEVLGCGGTIARLAAEGAAVSILILADGLTSRADFDSTRAAELLLIHHERARHAAAVLGAREVNLAGFPDQKMDTIPLLDITQVIEREIARVQPHTIFTQHGGDLNMDHVITYRATLTATRPMSGRCVPRVLAYEIASSTEWAFQKFAPVFHPQVFFDIAPFIEKKIEAMSIYESETRPAPHPRSTEALRALALRWGAASGLMAAEAFDLVREIHSYTP